jgi:DNA repair protein RadC
MKNYNALTITAHIPRAMEATPDYARTPEEINDCCRDMKDASQEMFVVICLNTRNRIISRQMISLGIQDSTLVHPREVFKAAIMQSSAAIVLVHNHPSGDPSPSAEDIKLTRQLVQAGQIIGIKVLDHVIIGRKDSQVTRDFMSLRECSGVSFDE